MSNLLTKLKPAASCRVHLLLAALAWTAVGTGLLSVGARWSLRLERGLLAALLAAALLLGAAKAVFILNRAAERVIARIRARGDGHCVGGFYSWRTWVFVIGMIAFGRILRASGIPLSYVGLLYVAVGSALLIASWRTWRAWFTTPDTALPAPPAPPRRRRAR